MKNHNKRLVFADRISIQNLLKANQSVPQLATIIGVNKTTIYRELERCKKILLLGGRNALLTTMGVRKLRLGL